MESPNAASGTSAGYWLMPLAGETDGTFSPRLLIRTDLSNDESRAFLFNPLDGGQLGFSPTRVYPETDTWELLHAEDGGNPDLTDTNIQAGILNELEQYLTEIEAGAKEGRIIQVSTNELTRRRTSGFIAAVLSKVDRFFTKGKKS